MSKTAEIEASSNDAQLYLERGTLYQQHEEYNKALKDYQQADSLGLVAKVLFLKMSETHLQLHQFEQGIACTERYLLLDAEDIKIHKARGDLFFASAKYDAAIAAYHFVIEHATDLRPENYLQACHAYMQKDASLVDSALMVVELGLTQLGDKVFILQKQKMDYLKIKGEHEAVLTLYDDFIHRNQRKENAYYQKATYLYSIQEYRAAQQALEQSKMAYSQLHPRLKRTAAITQLLHDIQFLETQIRANVKH